MHVLFQNVINTFVEVKNQISPYIQGLLLHDGRKNCAAMSRKMNVSEKGLRKQLNGADKKIKSIQTNLRTIANETKFLSGSRVFAIDGTNLVKAFAEKIQNLSIDYDGVIRRPAKGLSIMVGALISGLNVIPVDFRFWRNSTKLIGSTKNKNKKTKKKKKTDPNYKTKIMLAIELIQAWKDLIAFDYLAMDGAFASEKMIAFIESEKLKYSMRVARSRRVVIGIKELALKDQPALRLNRNERCKSAKGFYKGHACTFTVHKVKNKKRKWETRFIISNLDLTAKGHVIAYGRRWPIDKSFRSMKQYLGLTECQMLSSLKQTLHIFNVFLAYSMATIEKIANAQKNVEEIFKICRQSKPTQKISETTYSDVI